MRAELEQKLKTDFNFFTGPFGRGLPFDCGDGWFDLLYRLSVKIRDYLEETKYDNFYVTQVKEKYGTLRFYTSWDDDTIYSFISEAEEESAITCEFCGEPGKMRDLNRWYYTLCENCFQQNFIQNSDDLQ